MRLKMGIVITLTVITLALCPFSKAQATEIVAAEGFIDAMASAAGLTTSQFIASTTGIIAVGTGMNVAKQAGITMGNTASENLNNLIDAADYPDWDTLTDSQKANYDNDAENYHADKFNSLMSAFGMADARNRYYGYTGSGGANWEADWTDNELQKLEQIGNIGQRWISGLPNTVNDIVDTITNRSYITNYFPPIAYSYTKTENDTLWPSQVSETIDYQVINEFTCYYNDVFCTGKSSTPVPTIYLSSGQVIWFSQSVFAAWISRGSTWDVSGYNASAVTINGNTFYTRLYGTGWTSISIPTVQIRGSLSGTDVNNLAYCILYGESDTSGGVKEVEDYPENIQEQPDTDTYYPDNGIKANTTWLQIITPSETVIPETGDLAEIIALLRRNNYSDGELKVHDQKVQDSITLIGSDINEIISILEEMNGREETPVDLSGIIELLQQFQFYVTGQLKVHDEGVYDSLTDIGTALSGMQTTLNQILAKIGISPDAPDIIGGFDFPDLQTKTDDLVSDISTLAPFGSMLLMSEMVGILSQTGNIEEPKIDVPFKFFAGHEYNVEIDLSWLAPLKPVINAFLIIVLVMSLAGVSLRFVEMEAAS